MTRSYPILNAGGHFKAAQITCCVCGYSSTINAAMASGILPDQAIGNKFGSSGWEIGRRRTRDVCPNCVAKRKEKPVLKVVEAEKPREMGREDRRIIFEKLNEAYVDEKTGYDSGWSDHRVASDLGVPRKWVEQVREEMFGSIGTNAEMNDFLQQAKAALDEAREFLIEAKKVREKLDELSNSPMFATAHTIADRMSKVDRLANEVRKLVVLP